tara:strand:- start:1125 stop:2048 length:924 start_codon:yes stop_codon:yes gene_type:complete
MKRLIFLSIFFFSFSLLSGEYTFYLNVNGVDVVRSIDLGNSTDYSITSTRLLNIKTWLHGEAIEEPLDGNGMLTTFSLSINHYTKDDLHISTAFRGEIPESNFYSGKFQSIIVNDVKWLGLSTDDESYNNTSFKWWDKNSNGVIEQGEAFTALSSFEDPSCDIFTFSTYTDNNDNGLLDSGECSTPSDDGITLRNNFALPCDPVDDDEEEDDLDEDGDGVEDEDPCERELEISDFPVISSLADKFQIELPSGKQAPNFSFNILSKNYNVDLGTNDYTKDIIPLFRGLMLLLIYGVFGYKVILTFARW